MKKITLAFSLLLAAFTSCSHEDVPVQKADSQPVPAPVLSRSITATTATIVGYTVDGAIAFNHDLRQTDAENNVWEWYPASNVPTQTELENGPQTVLGMAISGQNVDAGTINVFLPEVETIPNGAFNRCPAIKSIIRENIITIPSTNQ